MNDGQDEKLFTRLVEACKNVDPEILKELDEFFSVKRNASSDFAGNMVRSICWTLENKSNAEVRDELNRMAGKS